MVITYSFWNRVKQGAVSVWKVIISSEIEKETEEEWCDRQW